MNDNMFSEINNNMHNGFVMGDSRAFPLGAIVFFYVANNVWTQSGVTHVAIVVGYKNGSPVIAHAANENGLEHAVVSRLRARNKDGTLHYIVVKPELPNNQLELIAMIAKTLCTQDRDDEVVVAYSHKRSEKLSQISCYFFSDGRTQSISKSIHTIMRNHLNYAHAIFSNHDRDKGFIPSQRGLFTPIAKMLNYMSLGLGDNLSGQFKKFKPKNNTSLLPMNSITHKGWHCVQFVVMVYQIAFLMIDENLAGYYNYSKISKIQPGSYFARKQRPGSWRRSDNGQLLDRVHPKHGILNGYVKDFIETFTTAKLAIPLESKYLSPAALLYYFTQNNFQGFSGGNFQISIGASGVAILAQLQNLLSTLSSRLRDFSLDSLQISDMKAVNSILEIKVIEMVTVKSLLQNIRLPRQLSSNNNRRHPDGDAPGSRKVARL